MDESDVRKHAEVHGNAVVAGDLRTAGGYLTKEAAAQAGEVMSRLPKPVAACEVVDIRAGGDSYIAVLRYSGDERQTTVESTWEDRGGEPKISNLQVV